MIIKYLQSKLWNESNHIKELINLHEQYNNKN